MVSLEDVEGFMEDPRVCAQFAILGIEADDAGILLRAAFERCSDCSVFEFGVHRT